MSTPPVCPIGKHIEEFTYRSHIMHFCFSNGPSQPTPVDWPMVIATTVGICLISTVLVYLAGILIVAHLQRRDER